MPAPLGLDFVITSSVDADHAGDTVTQGSRKLFVICVNSTPVYWMMNKQTISKVSFLVLRSLL